MGLVVRDVPTGGLEVNWNASVVTDRKNVKQLLEIGAVVFIMPPRNRWKSMPLACLFRLSSLMIARKRDGRGIVDRAGDSGDGELEAAA